MIDVKRSQPIELCRWALSVAGMMLLAGRAVGQPAATIAKIHQYVQYASPASTVENSGIGPWTFAVQMDSSAAGVQAFTPPGGLARGLLANAADGKFEFTQQFPDQASLDAAFPNGGYLLSLNGQSVALGLTGGAYPNVPMVQFEQGVWWFNNHYLFDPAQPLALTLNFTTNYAPGHASIELDVSGPDFPTVTRGSATDGLNLSLNHVSFTFPAGTFTANRDSVYLVDAYLGNAVSVDLVSVPGFALGALYENHTQLYLVASPVPLPVITMQPQDRTARAGDSAGFGVMVSGAVDVSYQWMRNGYTPIDGATGSTLTIPFARETDAALYSVEILAVVPALRKTAAILSASARLTVESPPLPSRPVVTAQPFSLVMADGSTAVFTIAATGSPTYQWRFQGANIPGATHSRLVIAHASAANMGAYACVAANSGGFSLSQEARLRVVSTKNPGRLTAFSVKTEIDSKLTVGFAVGPAGTSGTEPLLVRASGPALQAMGVPGTVNDPVLTLFSGSTMIGSNDNWGAPAGNQAAVTVAEALSGAFAFSDPRSLDAAIVADLAPSSGYTVQIADKNGGSGMALAEVCDATSGASYTSSSPRLINLSALVQIGSRATLTAGFVIGGATAKTVLIRGSGPALSAYGAAGLMPDPELTLATSTGSSRVVVATDAGWGGDPQINSAGKAIGAFTLTDPRSADSAILITLAPGSYTAEVKSVAGTAGMTLIEICDVP